jgi:hypothetical protein
VLWFYGWRVEFNLVNAEEAFLIDDSRLGVEQEKA